MSIIKKKLLNLYVYSSTRLYGLQPCQCQHDNDEILIWIGFDVDLLIIFNISLDIV